MSLGRVGRGLVPAYVSLAQTYMDDRQYGQAEEYFLRELECHGTDHEQVGKLTNKRIVSWKYASTTTTLYCKA